MHPVNVAVVKVEPRLEGRKVKVAAWVAANTVVPTAVNSSTDACSFPPASITLNDSLEDGDVRAVENGFRGVAERCPAVAYISVEVSFEAARVVSERVPRADRSEVHSKIREGA